MRRNWVRLECAGSDSPAKVVRGRARPAIEGVPRARSDEPLVQD